jgi:hypothetical protein
MMPEIWIANEAAGEQYGTAGNPFAVQTASEFDQLLESLAHIEGLAVHLGLSTAMPKSRSSPARFSTKMASRSSASPVQPVE